jgi:hypothetical protein
MMLPKTFLLAFLLAGCLPASKGAIAQSQDCNPSLLQTSYDQVQNILSFKIFYSFPNYCYNISIEKKEFNKIKGEVIIHAHITQQGEMCAQSIKEVMLEDSIVISTNDFNKIKLIIVDMEGKVADSTICNFADSSK